MSYTLHEHPGAHAGGPNVRRAFAASLGAALMLVAGAFPALAAKKTPPPSQPPPAAPKLTVVVHVVNDNGGTAKAANITVAVDDAGTDPASFAGAEAPGTTVAVDAGSYSVDATGPAAYAISKSAQCSGTIAAGEAKTCAVTADDAPSGLTVVKHVVNDNGGTTRAKDFTITVLLGGTKVASFAGSETGTLVKLGAGTYEVIQTSIQGYRTTYSAACAGTIQAGQARVCTIDDDDVQPKVLVITQVVNDDGGTRQARDLTMTATGAADFAGSQEGVVVGVNAGPYAVGQVPDLGYVTTLDPECTGNLVVGLFKTCRVTNDDVPVSVLGIQVEAGALGITELPRTGSSNADLALDGLALILVGTVLVLADKARARQAS